MGLGVYPQGSGVSAAEFLAKQGARVLVTDLKEEKELPTVKQLKKYRNIKFILSQHRKEDFQKADLIVKNPGIPQDSPYLKTKIPITNDIGLFLEAVKNKNLFLIAVTGTRGKSTVTTLIYEILKAAKKSVKLTGNIGYSPLQCLNTLKQKDFVVLELSSWQLHELKKPHFHIAVVTNFIPDHLNYYKNLKDYFKDKEIIFSGQTKNDYLVLNAGDPEVRTMAKKARSKIIWFKKSKLASNLLGEHNKYNIDAAVKVGQVLGVRFQVIRDVVRKFKGLKNRLELVREYKGVKFYNDTTATMPEATIAALRSFKQKVILISGGNNKNLPLKKLNREITKRTKELILCPGKANKDLPKGIKAKNLPEAVKIAWQKAKKGDIILFSPGLTWLPKMNEFSRGELFKKLVKN